MAFLMQSALKAVVQQGTARAAVSLKRDDIAGKTGTTNDQVDAWFAGFHPDLAVTVWVGFDTPRSLHEYASNIALPLWMDFMQTALTTLPYKPFTPPASIVTYPIDRTTGLLSQSTYANSMPEFFQKDHPPETQELAQPETNTATATTTTATTDLF